MAAADRKGVATANFIDGAFSENQPQEIVDIIANPKQSHFFNTDCVSCHTDTRQAMDRIKDFSVPGVAPQVLPHENWNVRNFGWFPSFFKPGVVDATVTRRAATETAYVIAFINRELLANSTGLQRGAGRGAREMVTVSSRWRCVVAVVLVVVAVGVAATSRRSAPVAYAPETLRVKLTKIGGAATAFLYSFYRRPFHQRAGYRMLIG